MVGKKLLDLCLRFVVFDTDEAVCGRTLCSSPVGEKLEIYVPMPRVPIDSVKRVQSSRHCFSYKQPSFSSLGKVPDSTVTRIDG